LYRVRISNFVRIPSELICVWKYFTMERNVADDELCTLYKDSDIITYIKINRLSWAGHVIRLEEQNPARRLFAAVVEGRLQKGRPKLRWEDGVTSDAKKLGERHWRSTARNRDGWQKLLRKALAQSGMLCQ
jgi:hypothetical protein